MATSFATIAAYHLVRNYISSKIPNVKRLAVNLIRPTSAYVCDKLASKEDTKECACEQILIWKLFLW